MMTVLRVVVIVLVSAWIGVVLSVALFIWRDCWRMVRSEFKHIRRDGREYHTGDDWFRSRTDHRPWYK